MIIWAILAQLWALFATFFVFLTCLIMKHEKCWNLLNFIDNIIVIVTSLLWIFKRFLKILAFVVIVS